MIKISMIKNIYYNNNIFIMYKLSNDFYFLNSLRENSLNNETKETIKNVILEGFEGIRKDRARIVYSVLLVLIVLNIILYS